MIKVIKNGLVLTMENPQISRKDVVIEDNLIKEIVDSYQGEYDELIDAKGNIVMPGLINCHTHLGMYNFRNTNDDMQLMAWLNEKIWPIEKEMTEDEIAKAAYLSCLEMIKSGTTCCADQYDASAKILKQIVKTKIRCLYTRFIMDIDGKGEKRFNEFEKLYSKYKDKNELITFCVGLHSLYTSSESYIKRAAKFAFENDLLIHMHYMENKEEKEQVDLKKFALLKNCKLLLAHGVFIENLKDFKNRDISIVHNPISNLALGCGIADIVKYRNLGINVCLGTDGVGSGYHLNMFRHLTFAYLLPKGLYQDPTVINAFEILQMATINGAKALGIEKLGLIKKGWKADLIIVKLLAKPVKNELVALLTNELEVLTTIINGVTVVENKKLKI